MGRVGVEHPDLRIVRTSVLGQTVDTLRTALLTGRFQPGERLVEANLCALLGVSRSSLREALRRLEAERLIDILPHKGPIVPIVTWEEALQIYHVRKVLEGEAAALAARHSTPDDHRLLDAALAAFRAAMDEGAMAAEIAATKQFYEIILRSGGNSIIQQTLEGLHARISFLRTRSMSLAGRNTASLQEMAAIAAAIAKGDVDAAREAAMIHIIQARNAAERVYSQSLPVRSR